MSRGIMMAPFLTLSTWTRGGDGGGVGCAYVRTVMAGWLHRILTSAF